MLNCRNTSISHDNSLRWSALKSASEEYYFSCAGCAARNPCRVRGWSSFRTSGSTTGAAFSCALLLINSARSVHRLPQRVGFTAVICPDVFCQPQARAAVKKVLRESLAAGDRLAATGHLDAWVDRQERFANMFAVEFNRQGVANDLKSSARIVNWAYTNTFDCHGLTWVRGDELRELEPDWSRALTRLLN